MNESEQDSISRLLAEERSVLGACLINPDAFDVAASVLRDTDWFRAAHSDIWQALKRLRAKSSPLDLVTLREELGARLESVGGAVYIASLPDGVPRSTNVASYARIVARHGARRALQTRAPWSSPEALASLVARLQELEGEAPAGVEALLERFVTTDDREVVYRALRRIVSPTARDAQAERLRVLYERQRGDSPLAADELGEAVARELGVDRRRPHPAADIELSLPKRILSAAGQGGAVLCEGTVAILAGEGGMAKSAFTGGLAIDIAQGTEDTAGGLFHVCGGAGSTLMVSYEDPESVVAWRLDKYVQQRDIATGNNSPLARVHVLQLAGRPLYGPTDESGRAAFYTARPGPLAGWGDLTAAIESVEPRMVVIDPVLCAYVGESNAPAPVREFLVALAELAATYNTGVLLIAHSTKATRSGKPDPFNPGLVGGTAAWVDGVRGALSMTWRDDPGAEPGSRQIGIIKANYGPMRLVCALEAIQATGESGEQKGAIVGFQPNGDSGWHEHVSKATRPQQQTAQEPETDGWNPEDGPNEDPY